MVIPAGVPGENYHESYCTSADSRRQGEGVADGGYAEGGWRAGREGAADEKRRARAVQHVARQLGVRYPRRTRFDVIARPFWHSPPQNVHTVLSAQQVGMSPPRPDAESVYIVAESKPAIPRISLIVNKVFEDLAVP